MLYIYQIYNVKLGKTSKNTKNVDKAATILRYVIFNKIIALLYKHKLNFLEKKMH